MDTLADHVHAELVDGRWRVPRQEVELRQFTGSTVLCTVYDRIPAPINLPFVGLLESVRREGAEWVATYDVQEVDR